jgi:Fur family ferric uptake transcriptional regulator
MSEVDRWISILEKIGSRQTSPRRAIVDLIVQSERALSPLEIFDLTREKHSNLGLVTVYRTLEILTELGLVERIHQADGCHMIIKAARGHEHIGVCTECGKAEYFRGDDLTGWIQKISKESGFKIQSHWLQLQGVCEYCQNEKGTTK